MAATTIEIMDPTLFAMMNDPDYKWGNYLVDNVPIYSRRATAGAASAAPEAPKPVVSEPVVAAAPKPVVSEPVVVEAPKASIPALVMRKDIWEHFPVHIEYINSDKSGCELWSVTWHRKRCATETLDVEALMTALEASPSWRVQDPRHSHEICVLQMMNRHSRAAAPAAAAVAPAAAPVEDGWTRVASTARTATKKVYLACINDIIKEFPAVRWNNVTRPPMTARRGDIMSIVPNGKMSNQANPKAYIQHLLAALQESTSWRVLRAETPAEICRLEMA